METTLFPPPPLSPPLLALKESPNVQVQLPVTCESDDVLISELLKRWIEQQKGNFLVLWKNSPTILQQGPQCGLVALTMAAQSFGINIDTQSVFELALNMGITKSGELFSSNALSTLANKIQIKSILLNDGFCDANILLNYLLSGKMLLVPYDADANHSPCLKNGHKAHWALIVGVVFRNDDDTNSETSCFSLEVLRKNLYRIRGVTVNLSSQMSKNNIHFLAKQGKSKRPAIWSYESLQTSNYNLKEVDPKRNNHEEYVLPLDNKLTDLCGKIIVLG